MKKIWTKGSHMPIITHLQNPGVQAEGEPGRGDAEHDLSRGVGSWRPWVCWRVQAGVRHELDWAEGPRKEREWNPDDQQDSGHISGTLENLLERKTSFILFPLQAVSFNFLPSQYQAGLALEDSKHKEHTEVLQDAVWKWSDPPYT